MVHISVVMKIHKLNGSEPSPHFILGSIAPDAIHMRENTTKEDKKRVHFIESHETFSYDVIRDIYLKYVIKTDNENLLEFTKGYFTHIITDYIWTSTVYENFKANVPIDITDKDLRTLYYQNTDQIDFNIYKSAFWRNKVWDQLKSIDMIDFFDILSSGEILKWRDRTVNWFDIKKEPGIIPKFITDIVVKSFITETAYTVSEILSKWNN